MQPLVSVIIPNFGKSHHFDKCINSVLSQTYSNLEIIIINNEQIKGKLGIDNKQLPSTRRIKVINTDFSTNWRQSVQGEYVVCVNPDDWLDTGMIESMLNVFNQHSVDLVECQCAYCYPNMNLRIAYNLPNELQFFKREEYIKLLIENNDKAGNYLWRKMFKQSVLPDIFFSSVTELERVTIVSQIMTNVDNVGFIAKPLYFYRLNKQCESSVTFNDLQAYYSDLLELEPDLKEYIEEQKIVYYLSLLKHKNKILPVIDKCSRNKLAKYIKSSQLKRQLLDYKLLKLLLNMLPSQQPLAINIWLKISWICQKLLNNKIHRGLSLIRKYKSLFSMKKKAFIVLGEIDYGNLGDRAIELGEIKFISHYFSEYERGGIQLTDLSVIRLLHFFVKRDSVFAIQGGGNMGTLYLPID